MKFAGFALALVIAANPSDSAPAPPTFSQVSREAEQARVAGRLNDAIRLYGEGVKLRPAWAEGWWYRATLLYDQDRFSEALPAFARVAALEPKAGPAVALLGLCEYETGQYGRATEHFRAWEAAGALGTPEIAAAARFHWGLLLTRAGLFEQALFLFQAVARNGGDTPALAEAAGLASLRLAFLPEEYPPDQREIVWLAGRAASAILHRGIPRAQSAFRELLERYPAAPNVHYCYGQFLLSSDVEAAIGEFLKELEISPRHAQAMIAIANEYVNRGDASAALPFAERAVTAQPDHFAPHAMLGKTWLRLERIPDSIRELELARKLAPENPQVRFSLSKAYQAAARQVEAERELETFRRLKESEHKLNERAAGAETR